MIAVIIAGGSGTRLWPLSTPTYPKHLLKLNGSHTSLLQSTYHRAKQIADSVYVVSEVSHISHVRQQLPELTDEYCVVEPMRRGTASCMAAVLVRIAGKYKDDEVITFLPADHYVRDNKGFSQSFKLAGKVSQNKERIVLIGVEPDYVATGMGYIEKGKVLSASSPVYSVRSFKEKPNYKDAKLYVQSGNYLWSCSYFVAPIKLFKKAMQEYTPQLFANYQKLLMATPKTYEKVYSDFQNTSIEYALMEKVQNLLVISASFDWMDVGSFQDMHKAIGSDEQGNHTDGLVEMAEVENSLIQNYEDKPVAVIGLDNVVVINTPDGILVARKDMSQSIGEVSKRFQK